MRVDRGPGIRVRREDSIYDDLDFRIVRRGPRPTMPWSAPAHVRRHVGLAPVEVLAPVARYDVDVEMSCKASLPGMRSNKMTYTESQPRGNNLNLPKPKATVTWLPTLVYAPAFGGVDPDTYERFVSLGYGVEETVVGAIDNPAGHREPVEDKSVCMDCLGRGSKVMSHLDRSCFPQGVNW
jgi:hypothetical protein